MRLSERKKQRRQRQLIMRFLLFATLFRLFLFWQTPLSYWTEQVYDDQLMYHYAESLADFQWLGDYSHLTLVKSVSYPLFAAFWHIVRIPYSVAMGILCMVSSAVFVKSVYRLIPHIAWRAAIYLLLLYSPIGFKALVVQRTYQMALVPYAVILVFSCMIALFLGRDDESRLRRWGIGGAVCLPFFYYIRDDSVWIMPFVSVVTAVTLACLVWENRQITRQIMRKAVWILLPVVSLGIVTLGICTMNYIYYDEFAASERTGSEFAELMDCLYKIEDKDASPDVWCSNDAIADAMRVSPSLRSIKEEILGQEANWSQGKNKDMKGDMPMWVMRCALSDAGYFKSSAKMRTFCGKAVEELDEAFESGALKEDGLLHLSSVEVQEEYIENGKYWKDFWKYFTGVMNYKGPVVKLCKMGISTGKADAIREWEDFFLSDTTYPAKYARADKAMDTSFGLTDRLVQVSVTVIHALYRILSVIVNIAAIAGLIYITAALFRDRRHIEMWLCIMGMLLSAVLLVTAVVLFSSWFDAKMETSVYMYLAGAYPLLQIAKYLVVYQSFRLMAHRRISEKTLNDRVRRI